MSRAAVACAPLLVASAFLLASPASAHAGVPCRTQHGTETIAHSDKARMFVDDENGNIYACLYSDGHPRLLSPSEHVSYGFVRFAGPYVAYVVNIEGSDDHVGVTNLRSGHTRRYQELVQPIGRFIGPVVDALVLKPDGSVAWIATNFAAEEGHEAPSNPPIEVRSRDRKGLRVLDSSTAISPRSLRLSGSTLRWTDAGHARSATLH